MTPVMEVRTGAFCAESGVATSASRRRTNRLAFVPGGLDLIGKAAVLKTAVRKHLGVRVPRPPYRGMTTGYSTLSQVASEGWKGPFGHGTEGALNGEDP